MSPGFKRASDLSREMKREHGSVLIRQWWPEQVHGSGQVVDLLCDLGQGGPPLYTSPPGSVVPIYTVPKYTALKGWESCSSSVCALPAPLSVWLNQLPPLTKQQTQERVSLVQLWREEEGDIEPSLFSRNSCFSSLSFTVNESNDS